jgi:hypothetical protein
MVLFAAAENEVYFSKLKKLLDSSKKDQDLFEAVVNSPFSDKRRMALLGLGIIVLLLVNKKNRTIERIALSDTELAKGTVRMSVKPFKEIVIPLDYKGNFIAEAIRSERYQQTSDWQYLFAPALSPEEARLNQAGGAIGCSFVYPLIDARSGGALIFSYYITLDKIGREHHDFMQAYARLAANALRGKERAEP